MAASFHDLSAGVVDLHVPLFPRMQLGAKLGNPVGVVVSVLFLESSVDVLLRSVRLGFFPLHNI